MIARLSKKLTGENWFVKVEKRQNIIDERNESGEIYNLIDSLFKVKENGDYENFKQLVADIFLEEEGDYFYIRKLFNSDVLKEDFVKEINGKCCCSTCIFLGII